MADKPSSIKKSKPEFGTPSQVFEVCKSMQDVEEKRAGDRVKINSLFNGQRPYSKADEDKYQIQINVNWGEGKRIMMDANRQLNNALLHSGLMFTCTLEEGRVDKREEWSQIFTDEIQKPFQRGRSGKRHNFLIKNRNATVCMHGIGAILWPNDHRWLGRFVPLEDLLIPTDTYCDLSNLRYFAVNLYLTPGEFVEMAMAGTDKGWNMPMVKKILDAQKDLYTESTTSTWRDQPEAMRQIFDQNKGYYYSDIVPKIKLRMFFWREVDQPKKWYKHVILREGYTDVSTDKFVYNGNGRVFADDIDHILNLQFGDANLTAPLKYHSVRGLGVDLFAAVETLNRLRCDYVQHAFETMRMLFKIQDPTDRDRLKQVILQQYGFIPEGLTIIPREQRHQVDPRLIDDVMAQMRGVMQENSASYVSDKDTGGEQEMTAKQAMIKLNQASALVNSMLGNMYLQEAFYYEEEVRRFCILVPSDQEVKDFQAACIRRGIPKELVNKPKAWRVEPEKVLGGGDRSLAQQEAQWLLQYKNLFDPKAQQVILRTSTSTMLNDPARAKLLVPDAPVTATDGTYAAENVFGTMMNGIKVSLRQGIDQIGYIEALIRMVAAVVQRISQTDNVGTPDVLVGLVTTIQNIGEHMMILAGDDKEKQRVKQYGDAVGKLMNEIKGFAQRQAQARDAKSQELDPKDKAKIQGMVMSAQVKAQIQQQRAAQKQKERMIEFQLDQARQTMETMAEIHRENLAAKNAMLVESLQGTIDAFRGLEGAKN